MPIEAHIGEAMSGERLDPIVPEADRSGTDPVLEKTAEGLHLAGSAIVTGTIAVLLAVIAIPVSLVLGARAAVRRMRGN
jgi:hypothetical protein